MVYNSKKVHVELVKRWDQKYEWYMNARTYACFVIDTW